MNQLIQSIKDTWNNGGEFPKVLAGLIVFGLVLLGLTFLPLLLGVILAAVAIFAMIKVFKL